MVRNPFLFIILKKGIKLSLSKNFSSETSERYALALFETAKDSSEIEITEKSVREILELYNECEDLKNFIKDPTQSQNTQFNVVEKLSDSMKLTENLKKFLSLLVKKNRIFFLKKVFNDFIWLTSRKRGEFNAILVSSKNLNKEELNNLTKEISQTIGSQVTFNYKVDKNLIGGLVVQIGSLMIDSSIKNKLKKYEQSMLEN